MCHWVTQQSGTFARSLFPSFGISWSPAAGRLCCLSKQPKEFHGGRHKLLLSCQAESPNRLQPAASDRVRNEPNRQRYLAKSLPHDSASDSTRLLDASRL